MSRFSLSFKFGLLLVGFVVAVGVLVGLFVDAGRRVAVDMLELKDRAFPEYEKISAAHDSFKDFTGMIEEVVTTGEANLLDSASKTGRVLVGHLNDVEAISLEGRKEEIRRLRKSFLEYEPLAIELATLAISSEQQRGGGLAGLNSEKISALSGRVADLRNSLDAGLDRLVMSRRRAFETTLDTTVALLQTRATQAGVVAALSLVGVMLMLLSLEASCPPSARFRRRRAKWRRGISRRAGTSNPWATTKWPSSLAPSRPWPRVSTPPRSRRPTSTTSSGT